MTAAAIDAILKDVIGRILSVVAPKQIFLFGSAARGEIRENSDIDLMVIVPNGLHRRKTSKNIYRKMIGLGFATDIVVVTEGDVEKYKDTAGYVIGSASREGRLVYAA